MRSGCRWHGAAVYASNHLSYYDTPVLFAKLPFQFRILAKAPLWKIPFIGWYLDRSGQVPIDQSSARAGVASLARGVKTLQAGMPLVIFPEGGRACNGELQKMVAGAAWMAIKAQVPLVPLTLVGTYELLPIHVYALRPRPLKLIVGEPISTVGMTTRDAEALTRAAAEHHPRDVHRRARLNRGCADFAPVRRVDSLCDCAYSWTDAVQDAQLRGG